MQSTPQSNRLTVAIYGGCNAGKSSLFNAITDTGNAIVSPLPGTTTDPVVKSMELIPFGPITLIDTAGLGDAGALGGARIEKTHSILERTDFALYAIDPSNPNWKEYEQLEKELKKRDIPFLPVLTKADEAQAEAIEAAARRLPQAVAVSSRLSQDVEKLKAILMQRLGEIDWEEQHLIKGLVTAGSCVVLVVPIDSEAPKGRLILPQVQLIRECLDNGIRCHVTTEKELSQALRELSSIALVVTDSQVFPAVSALVPQEIPLTSFSILMARQKCDILPLEQGAGAIETLQENDKILIAETCTHNRSHEDIGRVKIPALLQKKTGKKLQFDFTAGRDYPQNLSDYALIVHCGGCMITRREMGSRVRIAGEHGVPVTNYGMAIAACTGILARSVEVLHQKGEGANVCN